MAKLKPRLADYFIIVAILVWGFGGFWFNLQGASAAEQIYALVYVENEQVAELSFSATDQFSYELSFGDENEHTAVIEVKDGQIRMLPLEEELCPRAICSHTGWITYSYESIVCLPNQIMVVFSGPSLTGQDNDIDGITY